MWQVIIAIIIVVCIGIGVAVGKTTPKKTNQYGINKAYTESIADGKLNRSEIIALLKNLPDTFDREKLNMGAMCYERVSSAARVEYVCPNCGFRTLYTEEDQSGAIYNGILEIDTYRRLIGKIKGIEVKLDEREFCAICRPKVKNPKLVLNITLGDEKKTHHVGGISLEDIKLLIEFTNGEVIHTNETDWETPMVDHKKRLEELLGISEKNL